MSEATYKLALSATLLLKCPHCDTSFEIPTDPENKSVACGTCKAQFVADTTTLAGGMQPVTWGVKIKGVFLCALVLFGLYLPGCFLGLKDDYGVFVRSFFGVGVFLAVGWTWKCVTGGTAILDHFLGKNKDG